MLHCAGPESDNCMQVLGLPVRALLDWPNHDWFRATCGQHSLLRGDRLRLNYGHDKLCTRVDGSLTSLPARGSTLPPLPSRNGDLCRHVVLDIMPLRGDAQCRSSAPELRSTCLLCCTGCKWSTILSGKQAICDHVWASLCGFEWAQGSPYSRKGCHPPPSNASRGWAKTSVPRRSCLKGSYVILVRWRERALLGHYWSASNPWMGAHTAQATLGNLVILNRCRE